MNLVNNFSTAMLFQDNSSPMVTGTAPSSSVSGSPMIDDTEQAGGYLGYLALLANTPTAPGAAAEIARIKGLLTTLEPNIDPSSKILGHVQDALKALDGSAGQYTAYMALYQTSDKTNSPPLDVLSYLDTNGVFNSSSSPDAFFATTMFLLTANLPGLESIALSTDLETILNGGADPTNPYSNNANWMSDFLSAYMANNSGPTGALLQAILPPKSAVTPKSTTPNYDAFLATFTGTSPVGYANWSANLAPGQTAAAALKGIDFWYSQVLPSSG